MEEQAPQWSLGAIVGTLCTIFLVLLAALGVYLDGVVLTYLAIVQPGVPTVIAAAYIALVVLVPLWLWRIMRAKGTARRGTVAGIAGTVVAISVLFLPVTALALSM
jgi:hypothetical protein